MVVMVGGAMEGGNQDIKLCLDLGNIQNKVKEEYTPNY